MREKDEWRFATMEYGGQCVTTAGTRWMQVWSVQSWDMPKVHGLNIIHIFLDISMHI